MAQNTVQTIVKCNASSAISEFKRLGGSITAATAAGNLLASGIGKGLESLVAGAGKLAGAFKDVASIQAENIGTSGDFARLTGKSFAEAQDQVSGFSERMAKVAAGLSGDNQLYKSIGLGITDNLVPAFLDAQGVLDDIDFNSTLDSITTSAGLRAANAGLEAKDAALAVSKALSGKSMAELGTLQFFEASPAALAFMEKEAAKIGKDLKDMTARQRADVVNAALKVPDEVIKASQQSVSGLVEGFKSSILDSQTGLFGLLRDTNLDVDGNQSAFANFDRVIQKIFGTDGLITLGSKLLGNLGLKADPMKMLADGLGKIGSYIDQANNFLSGVLGTDEKSNGFDRSAITAALSNLPSKLGAWLAAQANRIFSALGSMNTQVASQGLGKALAAGINMIARYIANLDVMKIGAAFLNVAIVAAQGAVLAVQQIQWGPMAQTILTIGLGAAVAMGASALAGFVGLSGAAVAGIAAAAVGVTAAITGIWDSAVAAIDGVGSSLSSVWSSIQDKVNGWIDMIPFVSGPGSANAGGSSIIDGAATGLDQGGLFAALRKESRAMPSGARPVIANSSELIANRSQQAMLANALGSRGGGVANLNFTGNIIVNGNDNPDKVAKAVMQRIDREWVKFSQSKLTANY